MASPSLRVALVQMAVTGNKAANLTKAQEHIRAAAGQGANFVVLPECFTCPYGTKYFPEYAEDAESGETAAMLAEAAKEHEIFLVGGSFPERPADAPKSIFNTSLVFGPDGTRLAKHRKVHLFDIDIPGKITFKESETLSPGDSATVFATPYGNVGLGICYDIRFPELAQTMALEHDCKILCYPGAFNMTTGPAHWKLLAQARAVDYQCFVALCSPARDTDADYHAWGHSLLVSPFGDILAEAGDSETVVHADLGDASAEADRVRANIPVRVQRRYDVYGTRDAGAPAGNDGGASEA